MQTVMKAIAIVILFFAPIQSDAQIVGGDWCKVTIESVKCISASTGQDEYTSVLFTGIEIALQAGAAVASGGSSLGASAALQFGKEIVKETINYGVDQLVGYGAQQIYSANEERILGLASKGGVSENTINRVAEVTNQVMDLTSLEGMFNKIYGESPDALYIKVNGSKVWPSGKSVSIKSQQELTVGYSFDIQKSKPFTLQLMEYDYASNDDDLGSQTFKIPDNFIGTGWIRNQVYYHKEEGSVYMITLRFETKLKHHFINNLSFSGWDFKLNDKPVGVLVFENTTLDFLDLTHPGWKGFNWGIHFVDQVNFYNPITRSNYLVTFDSENSFTGYSMNNKNATISGKRRASIHRYLNNLAGSTWKETSGGDETYTYGASGTIEWGVPGASDPYKYQRPVLAWKVTGGDKISHCKPDDCYLNLRFTSENEVVGEYSKKVKDENAKWGKATPIYTAVRVNSSVQNQQVQTQQFQHRFINNIIGTSWNYTEAGAGTYTFSIGQNTIDNFSYPGVGWEGATWKVIGNDKIQLKANTGALMDLTFNSPNSFSGYAWNNNFNIVTGTIRQVQQQQQQTFQHQYINNIIGTSWNYTEPGKPAFAFNFGNGTITNLSTPGTFWDQVTWKIIGNDKIQLMAPGGAIMNITFYDQNNFHGYYWNDNVNIVTGSNRQAQGQQQQSQYQHQFINNVIGTSWYYTEPGNGTFSFTIGQGTITNFSTPGTYWDGVTWTISGKDQIQLRTTTGNTMDLFFSDKNNFSGYYWNNGTTIVSGTNMQPQN